MCLDFGVLNSRMIPASVYNTQVLNRGLCNLALWLFSLNGVGTCMRSQEYVSMGYFMTLPSIAEERISNPVPSCVNFVFLCLFLF